MKKNPELLQQIVYSHFIILAGAFIIGAGFFIKQLAHSSILTEQMLFYRFFSMSIIYAVAMLIWRVPFRMPAAPINLPVHYCIRSLLGFLGFSFFTLALFFIPISAAIALRYTSGLWVGIISYCISKQYRQQIPQIICLAFSFLGVLFIIRPSANMPIAGTMAGLAAGLATGIAYFWVSLIGRYEKNVLRMIFIFGMYSTLFSIILAALRGHLWVILHVPHEAIYPLIMTCILTTLAQAFLSLAFSKGYNILTSTLLYSEILLAFAADALFCGQPISGFDIIGTFIIIIGGITQNILTRIQNQKNTEEASIEADNTAQSTR